MPRLSHNCKDLCPVDRGSGLHTQTPSTGGEDGEDSRGGRQMTDPDVPAWVEFTTRMRTMSDELGPASEIGWMLAHAADMICRNEDRIARLAQVTVD